MRHEKVIETRLLKINQRAVNAVNVKLLSKRFILLRAAKGYIMCGYLDMKTARKFNDAAAKITGVNTIEEALKANIHSCTIAARKLGVRKGQSVKDALACFI